MYSIDHLSIESYGDLRIPKLEKRAAHVRLERHPAKIQKVKSQKVFFLTFRLFEIHKDIFALRFFVFRLFEIEQKLSAWSLAAHHLLPSCGHWRKLLRKWWEKGWGNGWGPYGEPSLRWSHRDFPIFPMGIWWFFHDEPLDWAVVSPLTKSQMTGFF